MSKSLQQYDLTTPDGLQEVAKTAGLTYLIYMLGGPLAVIGAAIYKFLSVDDETQAARDLIVQGRENGVAEMRIKMRKKAALDLGGNVEGLPVKVAGDFGNEVEIYVRYR